MGLIKELFGSSKLIMVGERVGKFDTYFIFEVVAQPRSSANFIFFDGAELRCLTRHEIFAEYNFGPGFFWVGLSESLGIFDILIFVPFPSLLLTILIPLPSRVGA